MKTIQITMDERLLKELDRALKGRPRLRSAFIRQSITAQLKQMRRKQLEELHREGYRKFPVGKDEFEVPEGDLAWGDE
jgi:metal-responsive CopG/Arc/MetJ family transcriptional regulator